MALTLRIVTPTRPIVDAEVSVITAPGSVGEFGVLPEHATFLGELTVGPLRYIEHGQRKTVVVYGGYAEVSGDVVTVLAADAELPEEIDATRVQEEHSRITRALTAPDLDTAEVERLLAELRRAEIRMAEAG